MTCVVHEVQSCRGLHTTHELIPIGSADPIPDPGASAAADMEITG
jgi:hypothetical protein